MSAVIDEPLVRALIGEQFPELAALPVRQVVPGGWNNRTFRLGDELLARLPMAGVYAGQIDPERRALAALADANLPVSVSRPIHAGAPGCGYPHPWSIYSWIPGATVADWDLRRSSGLAADLAGFLAALHRAPTTAAPTPGAVNFHRGGDLSAYDAQMRQAIAILPVAFGGDLTDIWEAALASCWTSPPVWVHGDFAPRNLIVDGDGALAGVIDFGQVCAGDPACDLVIAWTYLQGQARKLFRERLDLDAETWARARGWAAWKAAILASGVAKGPRPDIEAAGEVLRILIEDPPN